MHVAGVFRALSPEQLIRPLQRDGPDEPPVAPGEERLASLDPLEQPLAGPKTGTPTLRAAVDRPLRRFVEDR